MRLTRTPRRRPSAPSRSSDARSARANPVGRGVSPLSCSIWPGRPSLKQAGAARSPRGLPSPHGPPARGVTGAPIPPVAAPRAPRSRAEGGLQSALPDPVRRRPTRDRGAALGAGRRRSASCPAHGEGFSTGERVDSPDCDEASGTLPYRGGGRASDVSGHRSEPRGQGADGAARARRRPRVGCRHRPGHRGPTPWWSGVSARSGAEGPPRRTASAAPPSRAP